MTSSKLDKVVKQYILDCIDLEVCEESADTPQEAAKKVVGFIMREADHPYNRARLQSDISVIADHIAGLPSYINIAFTNFDILNLAIEWGSIDNLDNERENQKILDGWFNFIANKLVQVSNGYHIKGLTYE